MQLRAWRISKGLTEAQVGAGVERGQSTVHRWETGERLPGRIDMPRIVAFTEGAVTANDFHQIGAETGGAEAHAAGIPQKGAAPYPGLTQESSEAA